jgi:predicted chitinase
MNYLKKYESFIKDLNPIDEGFMSLSNIANNSKKPDIKENIKKIIEVVKSAGLKDNNSILGLISVIGKESGFSLVRETTKNLPDDEKWLRKTFPAFNDYEGSVVGVKKNREKTFYNIAYGPDSKAGKALGNTEENDGYNYRGGGYTQLTGRKWYNYMGITNPKDIETPEGAAKALKKSI